MERDDLSIYTVEELQDLRANVELAFKEVYRTVSGLSDADMPAPRLLHLRQLRERLANYDRAIAIVANPRAQVAPPPPDDHPKDRPAAREVHCFISYAHEDRDMKVELDKHLSILKRLGALVTWHDAQIQPGEDWARRIDAWLDQCQIFIPLISADFLASDYCYDIELAKALERHRRGELQIIPVLCRPTLWKGTGLESLQFLPPEARPVSEWPNSDLAWVEVATAVLRTLERVRATDSAN